MIPEPSPGLFLYLALGATLASGAVSLLADARPAFLRHVAFPLLGLGGVACIAACGLTLAGGTTFEDRVALGLPWLQWHIRLDSLAAFFLGIIGIVTTAVSLFGPGYVREYIHSHYSLALLGLMTALFIAGMQLVVVAADAFAFVVAWEVMSVASYFLVAYEHEEAANRRAAFLYLLMAQVGAILIMLCFGVLAAFGGGFTFDAMRTAELSALWASMAFGLGLLGFGMKAGIVPLHVWLPEAHPVAPSHISALMSGVMLKVAVYGFVRLSFDLLADPHWSWGMVLLVIGSITAVYGVLHAMVQNDIKRLLAWSSIENIGIIFIGLGLALIFIATGHPRFGTLGLIAALYHALNHSVFKSLLFSGAGALLQHGHERNLEQMGGLIRRMPWTALFFLVGCLGISALPPLNGFVSEWLTFQTALQAASLESGVLRAIIPISAAMLALAGALAAACFVKVYGVAFLGQARSRRVRHAREASTGMVVAQGLLAALCIVLGVLPTNTVKVIGGVTGELTGYYGAAAVQHGWLWLTPLHPDIASYSAPLVMLGVVLALGAWAVVFFRIRQRHGPRALKRGDAWDCGFGPLSPRMQYSSSAFAMPIRLIFRPAWRVHEEKVREMDARLPTRAANLRYLVQTEDLFWHYLYVPVERLVFAAARRIGIIQTGHLRHYLAYSFFTLMGLLWLIT